MALKIPRLKAVVRIAALFTGLTGIILGLQSLNRSEADYQDTAMLSIYSGSLSEDNIPDLAKYDIIACGDAANESLTPALRDSVRRRNIDVLFSDLIGIHLHQWKKTTYGGQPKDPDNFDSCFWHELKDYYVKTNGIDPATGLPDTASLWQDDYMIDITQEEAREKFIDVFLRFSSNVDMSVLELYGYPLVDLKPYQAQRYQTAEVGAFDVDQDGIDWWSDEDEQALWAASLIELAKEARRRAPKRLWLQNMGLALVNEEMSHQLDGVWLEDWPRSSTSNWTFNYTTGLALDNPRSLPNLSAQGRFYSYPAYILAENLGNISAQAYLFLLFDGVYDLRRTSAYPVPATPPPNLSSLGAPFGGYYKVAENIYARNYRNNWLKVTVGTSSITPEIMEYTEENPGPGDREPPAIGG